MPTLNEEDMPTGPVNMINCGLLSDSGFKVPLASKVERSVFRVEIFRLPKPVFWLWSALKTRTRFAFSYDAGLEVVNGGQAECNGEGLVRHNVVCNAQNGKVLDRGLDLKLV